MRGITGRPSATHWRCWPSIPVTRVLRRFGTKRERCWTASIRRSSRHAVTWQAAMFPRRRARSIPPARSTRPRRASVSCQRVSLSRRAREKPAVQPRRNSDRRRSRRPERLELRLRPPRLCRRLACRRHPRRRSPSPGQPRCSRRPRPRRHQPCRPSRRLHSLQQRLFRRRQCPSRVPGQCRRRPPPHSLRPPPRKRKPPSGRSSLLMPERSRTRIWCCFARSNRTCRARRSGASRPGSGQ